MAKARPNPLKTDPTRTKTQRRILQRDLNRRFRELKRQITRLLVEDDVFGLRSPQDPLLNVHEFSSTQFNVKDDDVTGRLRDLQDMDPNDVLKVEDTPHVTIRFGLHGPAADQVKWIASQHNQIRLKLGSVSIFQGEEFDVVKVDVESSDLENLHHHLGLLPNTKTHHEYHPHLTVAIVKPGTGPKYEGLSGLEGKELTFDEFVLSDKEGKLTTIKLGQSPLTMNNVWRFLTRDEQLQSFVDWLKSQVSITVLAKSLQTGQIDDDHWLREHITRVFQRGMLRAFDAVRKPVAQGVTLDFFNGTKEQFLLQSFGRPVAIERVKLLASRAFNELQGVTDNMGTQMQRTLVDGFIQGKGPREIAGDLNRDVENLGRKRAMTIGRTECLVGDTLVDSANVRAVFRRWYEGDIVEVKTSNDRQFTCTPNHPMLTQDGWISAGDLNQSHKLICDGRSHDFLSSDPDVENRPTSISEIFTSLKRVGVFERVSSLTVDFHGDGINGKVDVLRPLSELRYGSFVPIDEPLSKEIFSSTGKSRSGFCSFCGNLLPVNQSSHFCLRPQLNPDLFKTPFNRFIVGSVESSYFCERFSRLIPVDDVLNVDVCSQLVMDSSSYIGVLSSVREGSRSSLLSENLPDVRLIRFDKTRDLSLAEPRLIKFDDVLSTRVRPFSGHVYNLETDDGYFTIDSLYTGNTVRAHNEGQLEALEALGVESVGVSVEWSVSGLGVTGKGNPSPCKLCAPLAGMILTTEEAHGMLPRHSNCLCSFIPAGVGEEETASRKDTKQRITKAIERSLSAERPKKKKRTIKQQRKLSRWVGSQKKISKKRPESLV